MIKTYQLKRKEPVQAIQLTSDNLREVSKFIKYPLYPTYTLQGGLDGIRYFVGLEWHSVKVSNWIYLNAKGHYHVLSDEVFNSMYEEM